MCGLIVHFGAGDSENIVKSGLKAMKHRGESQTFWAHNTFTVGHRRLAITDVEGSGHPYYHNNVAIWNVGEYYDYKEAPDTLELLKNISTDPPGMYSAITHVAGSDVIVVHIDRLSKKPLYLRRDTNTIASEIKALTTEFLPPVQLNGPYLARIRKHDLPDAYTTVYKNIIRLQPGRYHIDTKRNLINYSAPSMYIAPSRLMLQEAVLKRVPREVPFTTLLSGGLDSSIVHHIIKSINIKSYPVHYAQEDDTLGLVMSRKVAPDLTVLEEPKDEPDMKELLYINESPLDLGSMVPQYNLFKSIRRSSPKTKVILTGDGADELFWGYRRSEKADTRDRDLQELQAWHIPRLDKFGMWFGFEVRCPFMDDAVYAFARGLDYHTNKGKLPIKMLANKLGLDPTIVQRPKMPLKSITFKHSANYRAQLLEAFLDYYSTGLRYER